MNRELIGISLSALLLPIVSGILNVWSPMAEMPVDVTNPSQMQVPLWFVFAELGWVVLTVLVYPVLLVATTFFLAKTLKAKIWETVGWLAVSSVFASAITPLAVRASASFAQQTYQFQGLFWFFFPQTILRDSVTEFLLALGAVALPRLLSKNG